MNPNGDKVEYPVQYCIQCTSTTEHMTVAGGRKRCRRCDHITGSSVIRDNLPLQEDEEIMLEVEPIDTSLDEPVLE